MWPRPLEIRLSNLKITLSILPWMVEAIRVFLSTFRTWSPTAGVSFTSPWAVVWCSVACTHETTKGKKLSVLHSMFFQFLMRQGWLPWMPFIRVIVFFTRCTERTAGDSFNNWTWTNMSTSKTFTLASSVVWVVPFAVTDECFDFRIVFSHQMKWSSCVHNEHSLSLFRRTFRKWINIACGSWFEELTSILTILTWNFVHFFVKSKLPYFLQGLEHLDFVDYEIWSGWH